MAANMHSAMRVPSGFTRVFVAVRPENGHLGTTEVRRARWNGLIPGCSVTISIYGLATIGAGAPEAIAKRLVDAQVREFVVQASARNGQAHELTAAIVRAATTYVAVLSGG